jgi:hypothetical protein
MSRREATPTRAKYLAIRSLGLSWFVGMMTIPLIFKPPILGPQTDVVG